MLTRSPPSSPHTPTPSQVTNNVSYFPRDSKSQLGSNVNVRAPAPPAPVVAPMVPNNDPATQYTILEKLGTGSFGTVYKGMHNDTKQIVAIKQIGLCLPFSFTRIP